MEETNDPKLFIFNRKFACRANVKRKKGALVSTIMLLLYRSIRTIEAIRESYRVERKRNRENSRVLQWQFAVIETSVLITWRVSEEGE